MSRTPRSTRAAAVTLGAVATMLLAACGDGGSGDNALGLDTDGTLVVAMSGEFQPFSYFEGNTLTGFDHDIGVAVAEELGLEVDAQTGAFDTLIQGLKSNRYDVLIASMTPTEERDKQVDFTESYYVSGAQAFVAPGTDCTDISQLDSPIIGVASGTTYQDWLTENGGDWVGEIRTFTSDVTALQDVATGRLDAAMTDRNVGLYQIQESGLDLVECGDPVFTEEPAFAVEEGNTALVEALDEALATIKENGTYAEISEKYFGKDISSLEGDGAGSTDDSATTSEG
ncbi:ABC transporter substrate-binding protein [Ornithinimicrobium humiphilum]|uniref:Amino acid ABC transporter substrate-binding protein (PAAT family) n=1 Tax=Ornithinimicrobium humiphilum TaxID=125288 RepID=A0A543K6X8_9MICO|nr:transporter substrate-binding domain-containing protein [Ornithinimicrobium humiphilum]TQM90784.1 amino acid ABC transporter substrate-binding protein (PAAT family) [Ornithinimicrobium humiphilum]